MQTLLLSYFSDTLFNSLPAIHSIHTANCLAPGMRDIHFRGEYEKSRFSSGIAVTWYEPQMFERICHCHAT